MSDLAALAVLVLLLVANAYFVAAEFAMVAARRDHVEPLAARGNGLARVAMRSIDDLSNSLATTQLGITACSLLIGAVGEPAIAHLLEKPMDAWGVPSGLQHPIALVIALLIVTFLHMVFGEMVPKNVSLAKPGPSALALGPSLRVVTLVVAPVVWLMNRTANSFVRHVLRAEPTDDAGSTISVEQLRSVVRESGEAGVLDDDETALISGALEFQNRVAGDVATPMSDVVSLEAGASVARIHEACTATGYSRFPIRGHGGEFVGYVHVKDVLEGVDPDMAVPGSAIRPLGVIDRDVHLREVLEVMRRDATHLAAVRDPGTGALEGITSIADVLRDVIGSHEVEANPSP